jgi:hypothetical protein
MIYSLKIDRIDYTKFLLGLFVYFSLPFTCQIWKKASTWITILWSTPRRTNSNWSLWRRRMSRQVCYVILFLRVIFSTLFSNFWRLNSFSYLLSILSCILSDSFSNVLLCFALLCFALFYFVLFWLVFGWIVLHSHALAPITYDGEASTDDPIHVKVHQALVQVFCDGGDSVL